MAGIKLGRAVKWEAATFGVGRHAAYRGMAALERTGLVAVDRRDAQCPVVAINDVSRD